ncbi:MAG: carboxynorspermidine decarboxylase, partial [Rikenellaceae bacterium]
MNNSIPSPCYILREELLLKNLATIDSVRERGAVEIIVALKACAMWSIFPTLAAHSNGATASSLCEARLVFEEYGERAHTYAPTYTEREIDEILEYSSHITFNSLTQFERFSPRAIERGVSCGLRVNPRYSPVETDLYNPCVEGSRLGIPPEQLT